MLTPFHFEKSIQATAALLRTSPTHRMSRLRVLKLLYLAEREVLKETGRTITGDRPVVMDHGPVLTSIYNLIKGEHADAGKWDRFIEREGMNDVHLVDDPGVGKLSRYELEKLSDVARRFESMNEWALSEHTHSFEEWKKNKPRSGSCKRIPLDDVLAALKMTHHKAALKRDAAGLTSVQNLLSSTR
jgi:uncharacterized phage-associated protein